MYFSPELCRGETYDAKSDIWALGCLFHQLASLRPPFLSPNQIALAKAIVEGEPPPIPDRYSKQFAFLVQRLLAKDPSKRPSAADVLNYR